MVDFRPPFESHDIVFISHIYTNIKKYKNTKMLDIFEGNYGECLAGLSVPKGIEPAAHQGGRPPVQQLAKTDVQY